MRLKTAIGLCFAVVAQIATATPLDLFTQLAYSGSDNSPPPADALAVYDATLDIAGLATMPASVAVAIPRESGNIAAAIQRERMDRREGFGQRDAWACEHGDPSACEIVPYPDFPANQFSYTWVGRGDGYDLRLTVHHGHAVGVLAGPGVRYSISWSQLKELRLSYFRGDEGFDDAATPTPTLANRPTNAPSAMSAVAARNATVARIAPSSVASAGDTELDLLFLFTEEARIQAGGNPADCGDTNGVMASTSSASAT